MGKKEQKKLKSKIAKKTQKLIRNKRKNCTFRHDIKDEIDVNTIVGEYDGIKPYAISILRSRIVELLNSNFNNEKIINSCSQLLELSVDPEGAYKKFIDTKNKFPSKQFCIEHACKARELNLPLELKFDDSILKYYTKEHIEIVKMNMNNAYYHPEKFDELFIEKYEGFRPNHDLNKAIKSIENINLCLNYTERALLNFFSRVILEEFVEKSDSYQTIDYGSIKVLFEVMHKGIIMGLDNKIISNINIYVDYDDRLIDIEVSYSNDDKTYDFNKEIDKIPCEWISKHKRYNCYSIFKHRYPAFNEQSLNTLANAYSTKIEYDSIEIGREFITYEGIVMNYVSVLEAELKKLISLVKNKSVNMNLKTLITQLKSILLSFSYDLEIIDILHEIRMIRNDAAHGNSIKKSECDFVENELIRIFEYISILLIEHGYIDIDKIKQ